MKKCPHCGKEIPEEDWLCPFCHSPVPVTGKGTGHSRSDNYKEEYEKEPISGEDKEMLLDSNTASSSDDDGVAPASPYPDSDTAYSDLTKHFDQ
ncbi:MAG: zinc-ribbon domain-containing protein [Bacilli bacterium]|jgi:hypothetical protein|nr:zinc-ribbon domain-containing protein [Bacilli bacterium]